MTIKNEEISSRMISRKHELDKKASGDKRHRYFHSLGLVGPLYSSR